MSRYSVVPVRDPSGVLDKGRHRLELRHVDGVAAPDLDNRRTGPLRNGAATRSRALRGGTLGESWTRTTGAGTRSTVRT
jgi:hypothetical protein